MRISKNEIPVKIEAPAAVARQKTDFGDASDYGMIGGEHFRVAAGTDLAPLLKGLENDMCHAPHWGYMIEGEMTASYRDGSTEGIRTADLFFLPPGHSVRVDRDAEFVLFSPQREHTAVMDHINKMLEG